MSKQSEAKAAQGYEPKPVPQTCANCGHFKFDLKLSTWAERAKEAGENHWRENRPYSVELDGVETNLRCTLGGFAVKKTATCKAFARKEPA